MHRSIQKPVIPRLINKKGSQTKLKLFEKNAFQVDYDFEKQVNEFMAGVEVIEATIKGDDQLVIEYAEDKKLNKIFKRICDSFKDYYSDPEAETDIAISR